MSILKSPAIEEQIIRLIEEMTQDWDLDLESDISLNEQLIADLSFSSVDFVQLFVNIEECFGKKLGFHDLLMQNGKYIDDLSVAQLATFVDSKLNSRSFKTGISSGNSITTSKPSNQLTLEQIKQFHQSIPAPAINLDRETPKNSRAIFLLSPSRSGSTLLRVMLAGNSQLFAPPELHLLMYRNLADRRASLANELNHHLLNGTVRAIMAMKDCNAGEAQQLMAQLEEKNLTTKEFYNFLQEGLGERILVDKTPSYSYHIDLLRRAEAEFTEPLYIHLVRHPYGTIRSFEDAKLHRLLPFMQSDKFSSRQYAELAWLICHQNIHNFLSDVPENRQLKVKFEDIVSKPQNTITAICNFLGVNFQQEMLEPYQEKNQRMTDGVEMVSKMSGDLKFHLHQTIDSSMADRWQKYHAEDFLCETSREMARELGY